MGCLGDEYTDVKGYYVKPHRRKKANSGCLSNFLKPLVFLAIKITNKSNTSIVDRFNILNRISTHIIKIYQKLTRTKEHKCNYHISCSNFALMSYKKYQFTKATKTTACRLNSCR